MSPRSASKSRGFATSRPLAEQAGTFAARRRGKASRPNLEGLEERCLLSFGLPLDYGVGLAPQGVVAADFNADGRPDLATADSGSDTVSVLLGNGDGTFQAARTSGTGDGPLALVAADLNGDGRTDLVTVNNPSVYLASPTADLSVLLGNGDGTFQPPQSVVLPGQFPQGYTGSDSLAQTPRSVAVGDLNGDGRLDLVAGGLTRYFAVIGYDDYGYPITEQHDAEYVNVLLGDGDGTFGPGTVYYVSEQFFYGLKLGDFNGDGRTDVVTSEGGVFLSVLRGNGDGTLQDAQQSYVGAWLTDIANSVGDFDGDGKLDLLMRDGSGNGVVVLRGNGDGTFRGTGYVDVGTTIHTAVVGDVDADGELDIVVMRGDIEYGSCDDYGCYDPVTTRSSRVLLGRGDGSFSLPITSDLGTLAGESIYWSAVLADFDGDGLLDLAAADYYQGAVTVAHNDGIWTFPPPPPPSISIGDATVTEGNTGTTGAVFTVSLSAPSDAPVSVHFATRDGATAVGGDYQVAVGTLTFAPGETTKTITVLVKGDRLGELNETYFVDLGSPTNATIAVGTGMGTIVDDEPIISINSRSVVEGNSGTKALTFTVTLSVASDQVVTVGYATQDGSAIAGSDYNATSGTLTFTPGQTTKTVTVTIRGDKKKEADESFYVLLSGASSNALISDGYVPGIILNDDGGAPGRPKRK